MDSSSSFSDAATAPPLDVMAALAGEQATLTALAARADLHLPVPTCPPWTVVDLLGHVAAVYRWAAAAATAPAGADPPDDRPFEHSASAKDLSAAAAALRAALTDPARPCPTLVGSGTAAWWTRRQLHETLIHRLDLAGALRQPASAAPLVAADCIAEVVDTMQPRQVHLGRMAAPTTGVRLVTPSGSWALGPEPVAEVHGPELAVAALLWGRTTLRDEEITVIGDHAAAAALLAEPLTP